MYTPSIMNASPSYYLVIFNQYNQSLLRIYNKILPYTCRMNSFLAELTELTASTLTLYRPVLLYMWLVLAFQVSIGCCMIGWNKESLPWYKLLCWFYRCIDFNIVWYLTLTLDVNFTLDALHCILLATDVSLNRLQGSRDLTLLQMFKKVKTRPWGTCIKGKNISILPSISSGQVVHTFNKCLYSTVTNSPEAMQVRLDREHPLSNVGL